MPSLNRYEKVTCENCGTQTTTLNLVRHKKRCSVETLYCTQCPNFSTKSQNDLNSQIAKKHSAPKPHITFRCNISYQEHPGFYAFRPHKNTKYGTQIGFGASNIDVEDILEDVDDQSLRDELESCKHFLQIMKWRMEDTKSSTLSCHPSTCLCSTRNWIMYSKN